MKAYKPGTTVLPRYYIAGNPVGIGVDSWCEVAEIRKQRGCPVRYRITSASGGSYWVNHDDIRRPGDHS